MLTASILAEDDDCHYYAIVVSDPFLGVISPNCISFLELVQETSLYFMAWAYCPVDVSACAKAKVDSSPLARGQRARASSRARPRPRSIEQ